MGIMDSALAQRARRSPALRRPAVAAYRAVDRVRPAPPGPRVVCNSMPKSGTHLLATLLDQLPDLRFSGHLLMYEASHAVQPQQRLAEIERVLRRTRPSRYVGGHLIRDEHIEPLIRNAGVSLVTILRDPRAVVVSGAHYVATATQMKRRDLALERFPDVESLLKGLVRGTGEPGELLYFPEIGERFRSYAAWQDSPTGLTVRFEDLVGDRGGGAAERQEETVGRILAHLGYSESDVSACEIARRIFSPDVITFRSGRIDTWRDELPADLADEIAERCSADMERLGYSR